MGEEWGGKGEGTGREGGRKKGRKGEGKKRRPSHSFTLPLTPHFFLHTPLPLVLPTPPLDLFPRLRLLSDDPVDLAGTPMDALCSHLQQRLQYSPEERDAIFLHHTINIEWPDNSKVNQYVECTFKLSMAMIPFVVYLGMGKIEKEFVPKFCRLQELISQG